MWWEIKALWCRPLGLPDEGLALPLPPPTPKKNKNNNNNNINNNNKDSVTLVIAPRFSSGQGPDFITVISIALIFRNNIQVARFQPDNGEGRCENYLHAHIQWRFRHAHHKTLDRFSVLGSRGRMTEYFIQLFLEARKEGNVFFNDALNTFYLRLYGVGHMVKDHSDSERGNPLPPHELLLPISSKGSFISIIPQTG